MAVAARVEALLREDPRVRSVILTGSRARGDATPLSDWDFELEVDDFEGFKEELPAVVERLEPLAHQWDPYGTRHNYMVMLPGPTKVDIIIEEPQEEAGQWVVTAETLRLIEHHFWDWSLWLGGKTLRGDHELVRSELAKMSDRLLKPLGARSVTSIAEAVAGFRDARDVAEERTGVTVERTLEREVLSALKRYGIVT
jgi:hypothetical protein